MHIHGQILNVQAASFYGVPNGERAAAARRAAGTRKRLRKAAAQADSFDASPEATQLIGQWMEAGPNQMTIEDQYRDQADGTYSDFR